MENLITYHDHMGEVRTIKAKSEKPMTAYQAKEFILTQNVTALSIISVETTTGENKMIKDLQIKTPKQFAEFLKTCHCASALDFEAAFKSDSEYYMNKFDKMGVFSFICYLDSDNLEQFTRAIAEKIEGRRL